jgi:hypothetical protein
MFIPGINRVTEYTNINKLVSISIESVAESLQTESGVKLTAEDGTILTTEE